MGSSPLLVVTDNFYKNVEYTDKCEEIYHKLFEVEEFKYQINGIQHLGKYKRCYWSFQKESRFTLHILPKLPLESPEINYDRNKQLDFLPKSLRRQIPNTPEYYDLPIQKEVLNSITVRLGPLCDESDIVIVNSLLRAFTNDSTLEDSHLKGVIRK